MNIEKEQEGGEMIQQANKERKEMEKKDRNTILKRLLRQRSGNVGSTDTLNKRKRKKRTDGKQRKTF